LRKGRRPLLPAAGACSWSPVGPGAERSPGLTTGPQIRGLGAQAGFSFRERAAGAAAGGVRPGLEGGVPGRGPPGSGAGKPSPADARATPFMVFLQKVEKRRNPAVDDRLDHFPDMDRVRLIAGSL